MGNEPQGRTAGVPGQAVPAMSDTEQALAEALGEDSSLTRKAARDILAHPSMQAIARDAAAGRAAMAWGATERHLASMSDDDDEAWHDAIYMSVDALNNLRAAIAAALGEDDDSRETGEGGEIWSDQM